MIPKIGQKVWYGEPPIELIVEKELCKELFYLRDKGGNPYTAYDFELYESEEKALEKLRAAVTPEFIAAADIEAEQPPECTMEKLLEVMRKARASEGGNVKLTVVMLNTHETRMRLVHENSFVPYTRRTVQIELTPEQMEKLKPRLLGVENGKEVYEEIGEHWLEE